MTISQGGKHGREQNSPFFRKSSVGDHPEYYRGFAWFHIRGSADYTTSNRASQDALYQAKLAADQDIVVHTLCAGAGADTDFLEAIAKISGGYDIVVPGGTSVSTMESNLREAFGVLAGQVPPVRLVVSPE